MGRFVPPPQITWNKYCDVYLQSLAEDEETVPKPSPKQLAFLMTENYRDVFYGGAAGGGKMQPLDSQVLTTKGWKLMGQVSVGDRMVDPSTGGACSVVAIWPHGAKDIYRLTFDDGSSAEVGEEHLWMYRCCGHSHHKPRKKPSKQRQYCENELLCEYPQDRWNFYKVGTTSEIIKYHNEGVGIRIPLTEPVLFDVNGRTGTGKVPPYLMGVMLGDGSCHDIIITSDDEETHKYIANFGFAPLSYSKISTNGNVLDWRCTGEWRVILRQFLMNTGLYKKKAWEKFVPEYIFTAPVDFRLDFLRGLMDTDGTVDERGRCYFSSTSCDLAEGVQTLVRSLGGKARLRVRNTKYTHNGQKKDGRQSYNVRCWLPNNKALFKLSRKKNRATSSWNGGYELTRELKSIEHVGKKDAQCITVSNPMGLYVTNDFIVTHNSVALLLAALQFVHLPYYTGLLVRRSHQDLAKPKAIMDMAKTAFLNQPGIKWSEKAKEFIFPEGGRLCFSYIDGPNDHLFHKGAAYQFVGADEASDLRWNQVNYLRSRMRQPKNGKLPLRFRAASNPGGRSHHELFKLYIDPDTREERIFIPAGIADNPYLNSKEYREMLKDLDPITRAQLEHGDWNVKESGGYFERGWFGRPLPMAPIKAKRVRWWDLASTEKDDVNDPDWTAGAKLAIDDDGIVFIEDIIAVQKSPHHVESIIQQTAQADGRDVAIWMEQEPGAAGKTTIAHYARKVLLDYNFHGERSTGPKEEYIKTLSSSVEAGNVKLVATPGKKTTWIGDFLDQAEVWPNENYHDDMIDAVSKAFCKIASKKKRCGAWGRRNRR